MTRSESSEYKKAVALVATDPRMAAVIITGLWRAGSRRTQAQMEHALGVYPGVRRFVSGTCTTAYVVLS
jgi:hypothetical protein